jgi:hypothetical protein
MQQAADDSAVVLLYKSFDGEAFWVVGITFISSLQLDAVRVFNRRAARRVCLTTEVPAPCCCCPAIA